MLTKVREAHVNPLWDETYLRSASPMSERTVDGSGLRHSFSRSYIKVSVSTRYLNQTDTSNHAWGLGGSTSMVRSSSIFTALPKMKIYCMRFANSHIFRSLSSMLGSGAGSDASISSRPLFREPIFTDRSGCACALWLAGAEAANEDVKSVGEGS